VRAILNKGVESAELVELLRDIGQAGLRGELIQGVIQNV
jgi:hypothetical protein